MKANLALKYCPIYQCFNPVAGIHCNESSYRFIMAQAQAFVSIPLPGFIVMKGDRLWDGDRFNASFNPVAGIHCNESRNFWVKKLSELVSIPLPGFIVMKVFWVRGCSHRSLFQSRCRDSL